ITSATKSGTDRLHGNVYNFLTTDKLDAANFFLRKRLPLTQDNWGAAVGGPVPKITWGGKTFWFVNVGGRIFMVPMFVTFLGLTQKQAVATSLAVIIFTSVAATLSNVRASQPLIQ